jgi:Fe-S-cluster-containing dehydrogenase component/anaerobic selenocysteine-containing dehydrogenase
MSQDDKGERLVTIRKNAGSRRDFLSLMGFSLGAAACRAPVQNALPLPVGSDALVPGVANHYATTCGGCAAACALVVKQRDGRPIKIEGNAESSLFGGGTCATGQATVLSLYDDERLRGPLWHGKPVGWKDLDREVRRVLAQSDERAIVLLSGTITSPSLRAVIAAWQARHPRFRHVTYDAVSLSGLRTAYERGFGRAVVPHFSFDRARVVVALEADFLGTWLSPVEHARQYARRRSELLHVQVESGLSLTGSNADLRIAVAPSELGRVAVALLARVAKAAGERPPESRDPGDPGLGAQLDRVADALWQRRGESLVVSGQNDPALQTVVATLNVLLGNFGETIDLARPSLQRQGDDAAVAKLLDDLDAGAVHTLLLHGVNPIYDHPSAARWRRGLEKVPLSISFSDRRDETSALAHAVCPDHHYLESWGDAEPVAGHLSLAQPLIAPLFDTRAATESLLRWLGDETDHHTFLRRHWREEVFPRQREIGDFDAFWDHALQRGVVELPHPPQPLPTFRGDWRAAAGAILDEPKTTEPLELLAYESVALRDGRHANNPWLQELPDPITKTTWGNFAALAPVVAQRLGVELGDVVAVRTAKGVLELPVMIQPGQHERAVTVALGHGRRQVGRAGNLVGGNVAPLLPLADGFRRAFTGATLVKVGRRQPLAITQAHGSMEGRPLVLEMDESSDEREALPTLWGERARGEHDWGMAIDLDACTGCSACVVACQAENNVPVVGADQVRRNRSMHWIRIDRYYTDDARVFHQPMMCQHCGHAPCETVCPVVATTRSSEGLNQQVYNRCIGTRYCANNCPYKVRRFNWYHYAEQSEDSPSKNPLGRLVLNPDVVVRSRGVMEKCSLCVQRIQLGKNVALQGRRSIADGEIQTACQQSCPTDAIVFGDLADPESRVARLLQSRRAYRVLEELGTRPNVGYLKKLRREV